MNPHDETRYPNDLVRRFTRLLGFEATMQKDRDNQRERQTNTQLQKITFHFLSLMNM